jgi:hypothetical protein
MIQLKTIQELTKLAEINNYKRWMIKLKDKSYPNKEDIKYIVEECECAIMNAALLGRHKCSAYSVRFSSNTSTALEEAIKSKLHDFHPDISHEALFDRETKTFPGVHIVQISFSWV